MLNKNNTNSITLSKNDEGFAISGSLVFETVSKIVDQGAERIQQHKTDEIVVDCQQLSRIDSAGIATLLAWQRESSHLNITCRFEQLPKQATSLLKAYRL